MESTYYNHLEAYYQMVGVSTFKTNGLLFKSDGFLITQTKDIAAKSDNDFKLHKIFNSLKGWFALYYYETQAPTEWYSVVCKQKLTIEQYPSSGIRNKVRKGLKLCRVEKATAEDVLTYAYDIYIKLTESRNGKPVSKEYFDRDINAKLRFPELFDFIFIYYDNIPIGYSIIYKLFPDEAQISVIRINPAYLKYYPSYSLFHYLAHEYLGTYKFLLNGFRSISHKTNIQELLIDNFGYEKLPLKIEYAARFPLNFVLEIAYPFRNYLGRIKKLQVAFKLMEIAKK